MAEITLGNLYEFNKSAMSQMKILDPIAFNIGTEKVIKDLSERKSKYWMLLNNERKDYTVFNIKTKEGTLSAFREALQNRGNLVDIDLLDDNNYEIWIRDPETEENFVYYLFDYSFGMIIA